MQFQPTVEQRMIQRAARRITEEEFADAAFTWESEFPSENVETLAEQGLLGIALSAEYGGGSGSVVEVLLAQEAVGRVCPDTAHVLSRSSMGAPRAIDTLGSDSLKEKYLPRVCAGDLVMSVAISEAQAGSDASSMTTTATVDDDIIVVNGRKLWVTKGDIAGAFLVYAKFADGNVGAIVIDEEAPGFSRGRADKNMAGHEQHELIFDDCEVPEENVLVYGGGESFKQLLIEFNIERCHNAMMCVACGLNAFDKALEHAQNREQFGQPIAEFQGIEWKLAEMARKLEEARLMIYRAAANAIEDAPSRLETSMAKVSGNEAGQFVVDQALQIHGAMGYSKASPIEYLYRWVRGWSIAGGTVEVQRNMMADELKKNGLGSL